MTSQDKIVLVGFEKYFVKEKWIRMVGFENSCCVFGCADVDDMIVVRLNFRFGTDRKFRSGHQVDM